MSEYLHFRFLNCLTITKTITIRIFRDYASSWRYKVYQDHNVNGIFWLIPKYMYFLTKKMKYCQHGTERHIIWIWIKIRIWSLDYEDLNQGIGELAPSSLPCYWGYSVYLEDHPSTCKWLITMMIASPLSKACFPSITYQWVISGKLPTTW